MKMSMAMAMVTTRKEWQEPRQVTHLCSLSSGQATTVGDTLKKSYSILRALDGYHERKAKESKGEGDEKARRVSPFTYMFI